MAVKTKKLTKAESENMYYVPDDGYDYKVYAYKTGSLITDNKGNDYLIGGNGDDVLITTKGNDTISGGKGENSLNINGETSGNDTILLGKGTDHLYFENSNNFEYSKTGNDLIITHDNGVVTVKNYFKSKEGKASLKDLNEQDLIGLINDAGLTLNGITEKTKKIAGTYLSDVIEAKGDVKNTITTGKGNDKVTAGLGADTITIDGAGDKTIFIKKGDGDDTIVFKGEGLKANVTLSFDYDQDSPDFAGYGFERSGNNLLIKRSWIDEHDNDVIETTTIKDYFKNNLNISLKRDSGVEAYELSDFIELVGSVSVNGNPFKSNTLIGTDYDDFINGGIKADKISTGDGYDTVFALGGNDKITINGKGGKDLYISREDGNDTILFDLDDVTVTEKINVNIILEELYGVPATTTYTIAKNQKDLIITNAYDKVDNHKAVNQVITVKNYFGNTNKINLYVDGDDVYAALEEDKGDITVKGTTITGTVFDDEIEGTDKSDTIYALAGDDKITASKGNDKIYGGDGDDRYIYNEFDQYTYQETPSLGHDTIYNSNGTDTISLTGITGYTAANYFEPAIIHENSRVFPSYIDNQFYGHLHYFKKGNDLVISPYELYDYHNKYDDSDVNTITLKDYFKAGKDGFGVKYIDNGEDKYIESEWDEHFDEETGEWVGDIVKNEDFEQINILDNATLMFDGNETPNLISWLKPNNFTGTFMNDIIRGNSKPDTLRGGDGNDILYGNYANGPKKDKLYGDAGNDIIFASDTEAYGGTGNDIFVSDFLDGSDIISDESGYDRLSLRNRQYLTYFDVTQKNGEVTSTGDIYFKDVTSDVDAIREVAKTNYVLRYKEDGNLDLDDYGNPQYDWVGEKVDAVVARFAGRPAFEVSNAYLEQVATDPTILENFNDYGENKRYIDGWELSNYKAREGYTLIFADWDFFVKDYDYDYHGTDVTAEEKYDNYKDNQYPANYLYQTDADYVAEHNNLIGTKEVEDSYAKSAYAMSTEEYEMAGIRSILQDKENGVVIKNGTKQATAIETVSLDRGAVDTIGIDSKIDNLKLGDYSQEKIDTVAKNVAGWLKENNFASVQDAIKKGSDEQLGQMLAIFEDVYVWTDDVKYRNGSYAEATSEYGGTIVGTAILEDNAAHTIGDVCNSTYALSFTNKDRASMLSDYSGKDSIILDYNEDGYSFLFDVEVDKKGNLVNYSRDFYIKFAGEEGENTGVVISYGRETRHAIETIYMNDSEGENYETLFEYDQDMIDAVRQNVAGWLVDNNYGSVQDVLHSGNETDVASMMQVFAHMYSEA